MYKPSPSMRSPRKVPTYLSPRTGSYSKNLQEFTYRSRMSKTQSHFFRCGTIHHHTQSRLHASEYPAKKFQIAAIISYFIPVHASNLPSILPYKGIHHDICNFHSPPYSHRRILHCKHHLDGIEYETKQITVRDTIIEF